MRPPFSAMSRSFLVDSLILKKSPDQSLGSSLSRQPAHPPGLHPHPFGVMGRAGSDVMGMCCPFCITGPAMSTPGSALSVGVGMGLPMLPLSVSSSSAMAAMTTSKPLLGSGSSLLEGLHPCLPDPRNHGYRLSHPAATSRSGCHSDQLAVSPPYGSVVEAARERYLNLHGECQQVNKR